MTPRFIGNRLCIDGFMYVKDRAGGSGQTIWKCVRAPETGDRKCEAKAITSDPTSDDEMIVLLGPTVSQHSHVPSVAEIEEAEEMVRVKQKKSKPKSSSGHRITKKKRKKWGMALMGNPDLYRRFLLEFSRKPVFDRKHLIGALKDLYHSETGRWAAYATILENKKKVERDIEALLKDPHSSVPDNTNRDESPSEKGEDRRVDRSNKDEILQTLTNFTDRISKLTEEISQLKERRSRRRKIRVKLIPPVPPAIPITEVALPNPSKPPKPVDTDTDITVIDLSDDEFQVKKEVTFVDLTSEDDSEIKKEYNPSFEQEPWQTSRRMSPEYRYENVRHHQNNQHAPPAIIHGIPGPPTIDQRLLHVPEDSDYSRPQFISNIQVPLHHFMTPDRRQVPDLETPMYAEIRFYHRPPAIQEIPHNSL